VSLCTVGSDIRHLGLRLRQFRVFMDVRIGFGDKCKVCLFIEGCLLGVHYVWMLFEGVYVV